MLKPARKQNLTVSQLVNDNIFCHRTDDLIDNLAIFEKEHCWQGTNIELRGDTRIAVNVQLADFDFSGKFLSYLLDNRREDMAGSTPISREIGKNRLGTLQNFAAEIVIRQRNVLVFHVHDDRVPNSCSSLPFQSAASVAKANRVAHEIQLPLCIERIAARAGEEQQQRHADHYEIIFEALASGGKLAEIIHEKSVLAMRKINGREHLCDNNKRNQSG